MGQRGVGMQGCGRMGHAGVLPLGGSLPVRG